MLEQRKTNRLYLLIHANSCPERAKGHFIGISKWNEVWWQEEEEEEVFFFFHEMALMEISSWKLDDFVWHMNVPQHQNIIIGLDEIHLFFISQNHEILIHFSDKKFPAVRPRQPAITQTRINIPFHSERESVNLIQYSNRKVFLQCRQPMCDSRMSSWNKFIETDKLSDLKNQTSG